MRAGVIFHLKVMRKDKREKEEDLVGIRMMMGQCCNIQGGRMHDG